VLVADGENRTAVLFSKEDAHSFLCDPPNVNRVYPITPNALVDIRGKTNLPILDPLDYFTDYSHCRILARVRKLENNLHHILLENSDLSLATKETLLGRFHPLACKIIYVWYVINKAGPWSINTTEGWVNTNKINVAHKLLINEIFKSNNVFLLVKKQTVYFKPLIRFVNNIIFRNLKNKKLILTTSSEYGLSDIKKYNPSIVVIHAEGIQGKKRFFIPFFQLFYFATNKNIKKIHIPVDDCKNKSVEMVVSSLLDKAKDSILQNVSELVNKSILSAVLYTTAMGKEMETLFKNIKPSLLIAHQVCWLDGAVLGEFAKKNKIRCILISHGTHTTPTDSASYYENKDNARGLLFSPLCSETITQSPHAKEVSNLFMPELLTKNYQPIIWGNKNIPLKNKKNKIKTILHVSSTKDLAGRPWIYETSNEYIRGLHNLILAVSECEGVRLVIRVRQCQEYSADTVSKLLPKTKNSEIKVGGDFFDDLCESNMLISFSSTAIEEALHARKPVGLYGGSTRYRHLLGSTIQPDGKQRSAVYFLQTSGLAEMLQKIVEAHADKNLTDDELMKHMWHRETPNREDFFTHLLD